MDLIELAFNCQQLREVQCCYILYRERERVYYIPYTPSNWMNGLRYPFQLQTLFLPSVDGTS